jgi:hypothetical protein
MPQEAEMTDARYPIGKFSFQGALSETRSKQFLDDIEQTPAQLRAAVVTGADGMVGSGFGFRVLRECQPIHPSGNRA